jgi:hypothetical protein
LRAFLQDFDRDSGEAFVAATADLNGDGKAEAVVHLTGPNWCGSGGCTTLILTPAGDSWRLVTRLSITRPPIRLLRTRSNGWRDLEVRVQGGGIQPGYEAQLRFDGKTYPSNPSVAPALRLVRKVPGTTLIPPAAR